MQTRQLGDRRRWPMALVGLSLASGLASGCWFGTDPPPPPADDVGFESTYEEDRAAYDALLESLNAHRSEALGNEADELTAAGSALYWLEFAGFDPTLHSLRSGGGAVDYTFSIGSGNDYNFRASEQAVASARVDHDQIAYDVYAQSAPASLLGTATFPKPQNGVKWWAYAVDGTSLYVVTTGATTSLLRYDTVTKVTAEVSQLESAGCEVGEFWDFGIEGDVMMFIESGRLWRLDVASNVCTFMGNDTEITGSVDFRSDGVAYEEYTGPFFYDAVAGRTIDLARAIADSGYHLNDTFPSSHLWSYDVARWGRWIVYVGGSGVFAYHLDERVVLPVLLEPVDAEVRVSYRYPVVLDDGTLFVTGLLSESGSTGADGPVYRVALSEVLR